MSQSDYIALKRAQNLLKIQEFPAVLTTRNPIRLMLTYNLETTISNTKESI
jgi:hypothetical protein